MKKLTLLFILTTITSTIAQENNTNFSFGADIQSRYIWRGLQLGGASASIQPSIQYSKGIFTFGAWGSYSLGGANTAQETDLYATVAVSDLFSITVIDYFFPSERATNNYLSFGANTNHVYEAILSFSGTTSFPIELTLATNFAGASTGSSYIEASYSKTSKNIEYTLFAGGVFGDTDGYYLTDGSGLINLGIRLSKKMKITQSFSLPINTAFVINPDAENVFLTFGFSL